MIQLGYGIIKLVKAMEGSHSGLVRPPAKRLPREIGVVGSNPTPSAIVWICLSRFESRPEKP